MSDIENNWSTRVKEGFAGESPSHLTRIYRLEKRKQVIQIVMMILNCLLLTLAVVFMLLAFKGNGAFDIGMAFRALMTVLICIALKS